MMAVIRGSLATVGAGLASASACGEVVATFSPIRCLATARTEVHAEFLTENGPVYASGVDDRSIMLDGSTGWSESRVTDARGNGPFGEFVAPSTAEFTTLGNVSENQLLVSNHTAGFGGGLWRDVAHANWSYAAGTASVVVETELLLSETCWLDWTCASDSYGAPGLSRLVVEEIASNQRVIEFIALGQPWTQVAFSGSGSNLLDAGRFRIRMETMASPNDGGAYLFFGHMDFTTSLLVRSIPSPGTGVLLAASSLSALRRRRLKG